MDSLLNAAARALAAGDPLSALNRVGLREDPPALALRGIAIAQLGDHERALGLLKQAARLFGPRAPVARARCIVAEADVCLAMRALQSFPRGIHNALDELEARGDHTNALHGRLLLVRRCILLGQLDRAADALERLQPSLAPPALQATAELCRAEIDLRRVQAKSALAALARAEQLATKSHIPALVAEVREAARLASQPAARSISNDDERVLTLSDVERLFNSNAVIVDGCRRLLRQGAQTISLARRPILFTLLERLGVQTAGASREALILAAFGIRRANDSHRARLRVEISRLRKLVGPLCDVEATPDGFRLLPRSGTTIQVLRPPLEGEAAALQALLADGQAWSTSALALALGESQRNVQRALAELLSAGRVRATGQGRARRWLAPPLSGFTTTLLLPLDVAGG